MAATHADFRRAHPILHDAGTALLEASDGRGGLRVAERRLRRAKRTFDIVVSAAALITLSWLLLIIAVAVRLDSPGPAIYHQPRVGRGGRLFTLYKFRSMYTNADQLRDRLRRENGGASPVFKLRADPRVTRVGRLLRRSSLDELPQLLNVLLGDMSLVGPRPPLPEEVLCYDARAWRRLAVTPGLTCMWQISGRSDLDFDEWVRLDLNYIERWSLWLDLKLILATIPAVITGRGAY